MRLAVLHFATCIIVHYFAGVLAHRDHDSSETSGLMIEPTEILASPNLPLDAASSTELPQDHDSSETSGLMTETTEIPASPDLPLDADSSTELPQQGEQIATQLVDPNQKASDVAEWSFMIVVVLLTAYVIFFSITLIFRESKAISKDMRTAWIASLLSVPQYLVVPIPLLVPWMRQLMWPELMSAYMWTPFWNIFCILDTVGAWFHYCWDMFAGTVLGVLVMLPINWIIPAGASCKYHSDCVESNGSGLLGYSEVCTIVYMVSANYIVCLLGVGIDFKRCFSACLGGLALPYMNPLTPWKSISPVLVDWDGSFHWRGDAACSTYIIILAFSLRLPFQFLVPVTTLSGGSVSFDCFWRAKQEASALATNMLDCMAFVMTKRTALLFVMEGNEAAIRALTGSIEKFDSLLSETWWQSWLQWQKLQLTQLHALSAFFKKCVRLLLLTQQTLTDTENDTAEEAAAVAATETHLKEFAKALIKAVSGLCDLDNPAPSQDISSVVASTVSEAETRMKEMLKQEQISVQECGQQLSYLHMMRMWAAEVEAFQRSFPQDVSPQIVDAGVASACLSPFSSFFAHINSLRQTLGWCLCLLYCAYCRKFFAGTIISYSFLIQGDTTLVVMIERTAARIMGCGLGFIGANLPALILCRHMTEFYSGTPGIITYFCFMALTWLVANIGCLTMGWASYCFMLWGAFGGIEMLRPLNALMQKFSLEQVTEIRVTLFQKVADMFFGAMMVTVVDIVFQRLLADKTSQRAAKELSGCLNLIADYLDSLANEDTDLPQHELDVRCKSAFQIASYAGKEQTMFSGPWPTDFADLLVKELESFRLNIFLLQNAKKSLGKEDFTKLLKTYMPHGLVPCLREYQKAAFSAITEEETCSLDEAILEQNSYSLEISNKEVKLDTIIDVQHLEEDTFAGAASSGAIAIFAMCKSAKRIEVALQRESNTIRLSSMLSEAQK